MTRRRPEVALQPLPPSTIDDAIETVSRLSAAGFRLQALTQAFAVLEAIGRLALAPRLASPHTPGSVIETLTFDGFLSQTDAQRLRSLAAIRNRFVHGDFTTELSDDDAQFMRLVIASVWRDVQMPEAAE